MITITIAEQVNNHNDVVDLLRHIANLIDQGYTRGFYPNWNISGEEDFTEIDN